jgi:hypothetical protein
MVHKPGDEDPDFSPRDGLIHVPDHARYVVTETSLGVELTYGEEQCRVEVQVVDDNEIRLVYEASSKTDLQIEAHVPLIPRLNAPVKLSSGENLSLDETPFDRTGEEWLEHAGYRLTLPKQASLVWPALPHNPYRKGGESTYEEGMLVVVLPFQVGVTRQELRLVIDS